MVNNFQIGEFVFIPSLNQLHHLGQVSTLEPKVIDLLLFFVQRPSLIASREDIRKAIWGNISVSEHAINRLISQLRKALSDNSQPYQYIETIAKRGYRFVATVRILDEGEKYTAKVETPYQPKYFWLVVVTIFGLLCLLFVFKEKLKISEQPFQINGGTIKQISAIPGREWLPEYSSNNQWVTFLHFDKVTKRFQIMLKGDQQTVVSSIFSTEKVISDYFWLPDQNRLLVATFDGEQCSIEQFELLKPFRTLVKTPFTVFCGLQPTRAISWSQIDKKLYWLEDNGELHRQKLNTQQLPFTIENFSVEEQVHSVLNAYHLSLSSNGKYLALLKHYQEERSEIQVYDIENNQLETIFKSHSFIHSLSWDNFNQQLIFVENNAIKILTLNGKVSIAGFNSENDIYNLYYSTQKSELLYATSNAKYQITHLTKQTNGSFEERSPQWRSQMNERNPVYSHDGKSIAYISQSGGQYGISIKADDKIIEPIKLQDLDLSQTLIRWSPDDQQLLFHSKNSLYIYSLATKKYKQITDDKIYADVVAWSYRDPTSIYFRSDLDGQMNIWLLSLKSGETKKLTVNGGFSGNESQDGKYFYYTKEHEDGLWRHNLTTKEDVLLLRSFSRENHLSWYLVEQGVYYLYSQDQVPSIYYYAFDGKHEQLIWRFNPWLHGGFTISPDEKNIYLGLKEQIEWNVMSVDTK